MNRLLSAKPLVAAALAFGALAATSAAHARSDVQFSIGIGGPVGYAAPAPVYVQPAPVYMEPRPVYVQPGRVYYEQYPAYPGWRHRHHERRGGWGDYDRDGVPNRYDRAPANPYRR